MRSNSDSIRRWLLLASGLLCFLPAVPARAQDRVRETLEVKVNLPKGIDRNTPLKDALEFLRDRYDVNLTTDNKAFQKNGIEDIENQPVRLPRLTNVRLATTLHLLGHQIHATYVVQNDGVLIIPQHPNKEAGDIPSFGRTQPERELRRKLADKFTIDKDIARIAPLADVLDYLRERHDLNIFVDDRAFQRALHTFVDHPALPRARLQEFEDTQIRLEPMNGLPLHLVLQRVLFQGGSSYQVYENVVWVKPMQLFLLEHERRPR